MSRKLLALAMLSCLAAGSGCALCASPYDYTGPIVGDGLGFRDRAGSILGGYIDGGYEGQIIEESQMPSSRESVPTPAAEPMQQAPRPQPPATGMRPMHRIVR